MAGSGIKRRRREIAEQAVLRAAHELLMLSTAEVDRAILEAYRSGEDPVLLMLPTARALVKAAEGGDVGAIRETFDRVSGKVVQGVELGDVDPRPGITITILQVPQALSAPTRDGPVCVEGEFMAAESERPA